jgi:uncharacterized repeat protein (TIGR01451 family)
MRFDVATPTPRRFGLRRAVLLPVALLVFAQLAPALPSSARVTSAAVPPGLQDTVVAQLSGPTALAFTPDGRLLITAKTGTLRVSQNGGLLPTPAIDISAKLCSDSERGLLGVAVDPAFATTRFVYLFYTFRKFGVCPTSGPSTPVNRVSRFVLPPGNVINPSSETVLVDNMTSVTGVHNAGDLQFGKDGFLYIAIGDGGISPCSRDQAVLCAKILRITPNGEIPPSNPFQGTGTVRCNVTGRTDPGMRCKETFASGLRNPYRIAFDPNASGTRFFINDVGASTWEEIDLGQSGADYGWDVREGPCATNSTTNCGPPPAGMTNPIYWYQRNTIVPTGATNACNAIVAGAFVPNGIWPAEYDNTYLFSDLTCGAIFRLAPDGAGGFTRTEFDTGPAFDGPVAMTFGPHGTTYALYYAAFNGGAVHRIAFAESEAAADLALTKTDPPGRQPTGRNMTYTLTVTNAGPDTGLGATVVDQLPAGMTFVSATPTQGGCGESGGTVTCHLGPIPAAGTASVDIVVNPTAAGTFTNSASVSSSLNDPNGQNNADSESTSVCRVTSRRSSIPCP